MFSPHIITVPLCLMNALWKPLPSAMTSLLFGAQAEKVFHHPPPVEHNVSYESY
jgi:hypothetical protein